MAEISSPCIDVCRVEVARGICAGCGRTVAEIGAWMQMPETERLAIMERLTREWTRVERPPRQVWDAPKLR